MPKMAYQILAKFLKSHFEDIKLKISSSYKETTNINGVIKSEIKTNSAVVTFNHDGLTPILNAGSFFLYFNKTSNIIANGTSCYNMIKNFFDFDKLYDTDENNEVVIKMSFNLQLGTDFAKSIIPT